MLNQVSSDNADQLVLRSDAKRTYLLAGLVMLAVGVGIVLYRFDGWTLMLLAVVALVSAYFLFGMPALKVWTFDRAAGIVRFDWQPVWGTLKTSTYPLNAIVDLEVTSPTPLWVALLAILASSSTPDPNLVIKIREGEKVKRHVLSTNAQRDALAEQMKQIREFLIEGQRENDAKDMDT